MYPQSNAVAEAAVKAMKGLVAKTGDISSDDFQRGILEWRNTPAELVYGCQMRSFVPSFTSNLSPPWEAAIEKKIVEFQAKSADHYNLHAKSLPELLHLQDPISKRWKEQGVVLYKGEHRDYIVELPSGKRRWRNRKFLHRSDTISREAEVEQKKRTDIECRPRRSNWDQKKTVHFKI